MAKIGANQATSEVITMFSNGIMISVPPEMRLSGITYKEPPKGEKALNTAFKTTPPPSPELQQKSPRSSWRVRA
jgi:hypothetical protein